MLDGILGGLHPTPAPHTRPSSYVTHSTRQLNFLDRSNIGNAKAANLMEDIGINSKQYSIALTVTYVPYIAAELPLTLAIRKVGPNILIPTLVILWGIVSLFQGFITNYSGLLAARFFLGCTEGAIVPSSMAYLSTFYRRRDLGKRVAFYFSATSLAGAFSGLLAAAILNMHGVGGKPGWAWIFIL
jgi:MFS family permease